MPTIRQIVPCSNYKNTLMRVDLPQTFHPSPTEGSGDFELPSLQWEGLGEGAKCLDRSDYGFACRKI